MKRYEIYRNIRKKALIYGLPVGFFGIMMLSIIGSLIVIIFSFHLGIIVGAFLMNLALYALLARLTTRPQLLNFERVFPRMISNRKFSNQPYED